MKKRTLPFILALILCLGAFTGCQSSELRAYSDEQEPVAPEVEMVKNYTPVFESFAPDTVMVTINGFDVTWHELFYWYHYDVTAIESYYGGISDWDDPAVFDETSTYREFIKKDALDIAKYYRAIESKFEELGLELSEEKLSEIDDYWQQNVDSYGSEEAFLEELNSSFMTKELFYYFNRVTAMFYAVQEEVCGEDGENLGDGEVLTLAEEKGYMRAKHILIKTINDENAPLSDEEKAEKLVIAEDLLAQLQGITDPATLEAKVDELMAEHTEDEGSLLYTGGYTFGTGEMVPEFETAVAEMEDYGLSGIVESTYGYHIILRLPLDVTAVIEYANDGTSLSLGDVIAQEVFSSMLDGWVEESEIVFSKEYEEMDIAEIFSKVVMEPAGAE